MIQNFQKTERTFIPQSPRKTSAINLENFITENFEIPELIKPYEKMIIKSKIKSQRILELIGKLNLKKLV